MLNTRKLMGFQVKFMTPPRDYETGHLHASKMCCFLFACPTVGHVSDLLVFVSVLIVLGYHRVFGGDQITVGPAPLVNALLDAGLVNKYTLSVLESLNKLKRSYPDFEALRVVVDAQLVRLAEQETLRELEKEAA